VTITTAIVIFLLIVEHSDDTILVPQSLTKHAAFNLSCDGCPVAEQTMLRRAVRVCHPES